jgi:hypothetical protein
VGGGFGTKAEIDRALEKVVKAVTRVSLLEEAEKEFAKVNQEARDRGISVTDGRGYSGPAGSPRVRPSAAATRATTRAAPRSFPKKKKQIQILKKQQTQTP